MAGNFTSVHAPRFCPTMQGAHDEPKFIFEERAEIQLGRVARLHGEREVNSAVLQQFKGSRRVPGLNLDEALRKALFELSQHLREEVLTGGRAGAKAKPSMAPLAEVPEPLPGLFHLNEDSLGVAEKLFARLGQINRSAHPVQKATPYVRLQRLDRMADGRLG
ncbi:hypothetical protein SBV1_1090010 [Verrucomicrobia bacterium]|nr:hypothetical protein SBV1_1090010 [Verrucomicrobiota bacterium]